MTDASPSSQYSRTSEDREDEIYVSHELQYPDDWPEDSPKSPTDTVFYQHVYDPGFAVSSRAGYNLDETISTVPPGLTMPTYHTVSEDQESSVDGEDLAIGTIQTRRVAIDTSRTHGFGWSDLPNCYYKTSAHMSSSGHDTLPVHQHLQLYHPVPEYRSTLQNDGHHEGHHHLSREESPMGHLPYIDNQPLFPDTWRSRRCDGNTITTVTTANSFLYENTQSDFSTSPTSTDNPTLLGSAYSSLSGALGATTTTNGAFFTQAINLTQSQYPVSLECNSPGVHVVQSTTTTRSQTSVNIQLDDRGAQIDQAAAMSPSCESVLMQHEEGDARIIDTSKSLVGKHEECDAQAVQTSKSSVDEHGHRSRRRSNRGIVKKPKKEQFLACLYCRYRKVTCVPLHPERKDSTCSLCAKRQYICEHPPKSYRGVSRPNKDEGNTTTKNKGARYVPRSIFSP